MNVLCNSNLMNRLGISVLQFSYILLPGMQPIYNQILTIGHKDTIHILIDRILLTGKFMYSEILFVSPRNILCYQKKPFLIAQ